MTKLTEIEIYAIGLLTEESAEVGQLLGKALRFGLDTPGVKDLLTGEIQPHTPRSLLAKELGDLMAAIDYAGIRGVVDLDAAQEYRNAKRRKLLDPESKDNLGRRLAP